jgi:predicted TPR repeat methyltransferase
VNGQNEVALSQVNTALAVGIRDAKIFRHAGEIALAAGDHPAAERYLRQSAELNARGSEEARVALARLSASAAGRVGR